MKNQVLFDRIKEQNITLILWKGYNKMSEKLISKQDAINALNSIYTALWEIDIPSPTVPEYIEHHEGVQKVMKVVMDKMEEIINK